MKAPFVLALLKLGIEVRTIKSGKLVQVRCCEVYAILACFDSMCRLFRCGHDCFVGVEFHMPLQVGISWWLL